MNQNEKFRQSFNVSSQKAVNIAINAGIMEKYMYRFTSELLEILAQSGSSLVDVTSFGNTNYRETGKIQSANDEADYLFERLLDECIIEIREFLPELCMHESWQNKSIEQALVTGAACGNIIFVLEVNAYSNLGNMIQYHIESTHSHKLNFVSDNLNILNLGYWEYKNR